MNTFSACFRLLIIAGVLMQVYREVGEWTFGLLIMLSILWSRNR